MAMACAILAMAVFFLAMGHLYGPLPSNVTLGSDVRTKVIAAPTKIVAIDRKAKCASLLKEGDERVETFRSCEVAADCERVRTEYAYYSMTPINRKYSGRMREFIDQLVEYCGALLHSPSLEPGSAKVLCEDRRCILHFTTPKDQYEALMDETRKMLREKDGVLSRPSRHQAAP